MYTGSFSSYSQSHASSSPPCKSINHICRIASLRWPWLLRRRLLLWPLLLLLILLSRLSVGLHHPLSIPQEQKQGYGNAKDQNAFHHPIRVQVLVFVNINGIIHVIRVQTFIIVVIFFQEVGNPLR